MLSILEVFTRRKSSQISPTLERSRLDGPEDLPTQIRGPFFEAQTKVKAATTRFQNALPHHIPEPGTPESLRNIDFKDVGAAQRTIKGAFDGLVETNVELRATTERRKIVETFVVKWFLAVSPFVKSRLDQGPFETSGPGPVKSTLNPDPYRQVIDALFDLLKVPIKSLSYGV
jgi:hypothetical protein